MLLGAAAGMRTFTPPAAIAARGGLSAHRSARRAIMIAAVGELIGDKLPSVPARTEPLPYLARIASGAVSGRAVAGARGAAAGAAASAVTTLLGYRMRMLAADRTRIPDPVVALVEDAVAIGAASAGAAGFRHRACRSSMC